MNEVAIISAKRTPIGSYLGQFKDIGSPQLAAFVIRNILEQQREFQDQLIISECYIGCVLTAGVGQAPARQALLDSDLPDSIPCSTINKVCGSGMKSLAIAYDQIKLGSAKTILAGGMESMSNSPYLIPGAKSRQGMRLGHEKLVDHMFFDGLENHFDSKLMGYFADQTAEKYNFSRQQQDQFALESVKRAKFSAYNNKFYNEVVPVNNIFSDEQLSKSNPSKVPNLKPVFSETGTVTAANSSSISDGAAMCLLMDLKYANSININVLARIIGHSSFSQAPEEFTTAVPGAINKLLTLINWKIQDVDLFEINEAFSVVVLHAMQTLEIDYQLVNVNGGACALGHPIGASGCRIVVTLIHAMLQLGCHKGIASVCIGGGEAMAIAVEI